MNTTELARATFVIDRPTAAHLAYISRAMGVSRSELVRDVLREPIELMARWVETTQLARGSDGKIAPEHVEVIGAGVQGDFEEFLNRKAKELSVDD